MKNLKLKEYKNLLEAGISGQYNNTLILNVFVILKKFLLGDGEIE